jgi:hypothetical protein
MDTPQHLQFTIDPSNAEEWLGTMRYLADDARNQGDREGAAHLDLLAEDLSACIAGDWRDRLGTAVARWEYHLWVSRRSDGRVIIAMQLHPVHLAA